MAQLATRQNRPSVIRLAPIREFEDVYDRLGQLMNAALGDPAFGPGVTADLPWVPQADVSEDENAYAVEIDLPGVNRDQVDIQVNDREVVVTGEITEQEHDRRHRRGRRYGRFEFRTMLPGDVNSDAVSAQLHDGVLTITVPKAETSKPRHVEISE
jgi:HSP20 family protein